MKWMRVVLGLLIATAVCGISVNTWANTASQGGQVIGTSSSPIKTVTVVATTAGVSPFTAGSYILGFKLYANDANDMCGLYDATTLGTSTNSTVIDELIEASDETVDLQIWPMPYKLTTGLTVVTNGICVIYYQ